MIISTDCLNFSNLEVGDIVEAASGDQYRVADIDEDKATLYLLDEEEKIKAEYLSGRVTLSVGRG
jgi:hypothetical protein